MATQRRAPDRERAMSARRAQGRSARQGESDDRPAQRRLSEEEREESAAGKRRRSRRKITLNQISASEARKRKGVWGKPSESDPKQPPPPENPSRTGKPQTKARGEENGKGKRERARNPSPTGKPQEDQAEKAKERAENRKKKKETEERAQSNRETTGEREEGREREGERERGKRAQRDRERKEDFGTTTPATKCYVLNREEN